MKKRIALCFLFFSHIPLYALSYYSYDFRDNNNTINVISSLDAQSNKLPFSIFDKEWKTLPSHKKSNHAFSQMYTDIYYVYNKWKLGIFGEKIAKVNVNDGFIELLYYAQKDFSKLLASQNIYQEIDPKPITGKGNTSNTYGIYLQKIFTPYTHHYISVKIKLNYANDLQYINANGSTNSKKFIGSFDYIYSQRNLISQHTMNKTSPQGIGYGLDLEYIYNTTVFYLYLGVFNLGSYIYWKDVTLMHYDFDSEVIYKGEDGYNHYKPFGTGYYQNKKYFTQELTTYYKASVNYEISDSIAIGNNCKVYNDMYVYEPYINFKVHERRYKIGYQIIDKTLLVGVYFKYVNLELANRFNLHGNTLQANLHISF